MEKKHGSKITPAEWFVEVVVVVVVVVAAVFSQIQKNQVRFEDSSVSSFKVHSLDDCTN